MMPSADSPLKVLVATAQDGETPEVRRRAVQGLATLVVENIRSSGAEELDASAILLIKRISFDLLKDPSADIQHDAFNVLIHAAILAKRNRDGGYRKALEERQALCKPHTPLGTIDFALVFDMAMDEYEGEPQDRRELLYHAFREYSSSGRKFILC